VACNNNYRQREWRITGNLSVRGEELMRLPSAELISHLLDIDADFFGREYPPGTGKRIADNVYLYPGMGNKPLIELVNRVFVPAGVVDQATAILKALANPPLVVSIDDIKV
jgi:hypothetical protein